MAVQRVASVTKLLITVSGHLVEPNPSGSEAKQHSHWQLLTTVALAARMAAAMIRLRSRMKAEEEGGGDGSQGAILLEPQQGSRARREIR